MANATVTPEKVVTTPAEVTLTLSAAEIRVLSYLVGSVATPGIDLFPGGDTAWLEFYKVLNQASVACGESIPFRLSLEPNYCQLRFN